MLSNEQMEKLWRKYQREGVEKNLSIQAFCSIHNVPYNAFEKFLKMRNHLSTVHPVTITDVPAQAAEGNRQPSEGVWLKAVPDNDKPDFQTRIMISIRMTNGIQITKKNMDYRGLRALVEKLEVLC